MEKKYAPYNHIESMDLVLETEANQLSRYKCVMECINTICFEQGFVEMEMEIKELSFQQARIIFEKAFPLFLEQLYDNEPSKRSGAQSIGTLYNRYRKVCFSQ